MGPLDEVSTAMTVVLARGRLPPVSAAGVPVLVVFVLHSALGVGVLVGSLALVDCSSSWSNG